MATINIDQAFTPALQPEWFRQLIANAATLGLTATAWQTGSVARTIISTVSYALQSQDVMTSVIAQGGFLDFAATGSITFLDPSGTSITQAVTPEGGPGWLDILADSNYDVQRIQETYAGGQLAILNTSADTYTFVAGTYHVTNPFTKQTYSTTAALSVPPSSALGGSVSACVSYFGAIQITTSGAHGLTDDDTVMVVGVGGIPVLAGATAWTVTVRSSTSFVLDGSSFAGTYTSGGTVYEPTLATVQATVLGTVGNSNNATGVPDSNTVTQPVTVLVGVSVANPRAYLGTDREVNVQLAARCRLKLQAVSSGGPKGAYEFYALASQTFAPLLGPPMRVGSAITRVRCIQFPSSGTVYTFVANSAGPSSPEDVAATDAVIRARAVPTTVTSIVAAATERDVETIATVWLPPAYNNTVTVALFQTAIQTYFRILQIGGVSDPNGAYTNIVPVDAVVGVIYDAADRARIPLQNVVVTLDGNQEDLPLVVIAPLLRADVAVLVPAAPAVNLVSV